MRIAVYHYQQYAIPYLAAFGVGLERHGIEPIYRNLSTSDAVVPCDLAVVWGVGQMDRVRDGGAARVLVLERGYLGDRMQWVSARFDGLNGRGSCPSATDGGARWAGRFRPLMRPWRPLAGGYALLCGQVQGDAAVRGIDLAAFYRDAAAAVAAVWPEQEIRFRPHPHPSGRHVTVPGVATMANGSIEDALAGAALHIAWNSNSGVDAVMAGVPTLAMDHGSMAWPVASRALTEIVTPDREQWGADLAWSQWCPDDLANGACWEFLALEGRAA